jgi:hypothetical protein
MSTSEIIAELPRLNPEELIQVRSRLEEVLASRRFSAGSDPAGDDFLLRIAGTAEGLPADLARNHDHYLYGAPRHSQG